MTTYKLCYFNVRGLAETTRILFHLAGQPYEDYRYPIDLSNFSKPEYDVDKEAGDFAVAMDRLPLLVVNGQFVLGQSKSIERFVAKKLGFLGDNEEQEAFIDMVTEHVRDIKQKWGDIKLQTNKEEVAAKKQKFLQEDLPIWLGKLETVVSSSYYMENSRITLADVAIQQLLTDYFDDKDAVNAALQPCPKLFEIVSTVSVAASAWLASRPVTAF